MTSAINPGDRVIVTMPRSAPREGEYVEDRGSRARVLLDGDTETCVVLSARVKPAPGPRKIPARRERVAPPCCMGLAARGACTCRDAQPPWAPVAVPKPPKPLRSQAYRAFVRDRRDCACCGIYAGDSGEMVMEAHHHGPHAMGQKAGDETCIPLLRRCHRYFHDHGTFRGMSRNETDFVAARVQAELMTAYCHMTLGSAETCAAILGALAAHLRESA